MCIAMEEKAPVRELTNLYERAGLAVIYLLVAEEGTCSNPVSITINQSINQSINQTNKQTNKQTQKLEQHYLISVSVGQFDRVM